MFSVPDSASWWCERVPLTSIDDLLDNFLAYEISQRTGRDKRPTLYTVNWQNSEDSRLAAREIIIPPDVYPIFVVTESPRLGYDGLGNATDYWDRAFHVFSADKHCRHSETIDRTALCHDRRLILVASFPSDTDIKPMSVTDSHLNNGSVLVYVGLTYG